MKFFFIFILQTTASFLRCGSNKQLNVEIKLSQKCSDFQFMPQIPNLN